MRGLRRVIPVGRALRDASVPARWRRSSEIPQIRMFRVVTSGSCELSTRDGEAFVTPRRVTPQ
jgi:hypothetical protein